MIRKITISALSLCLSISAQGQVKELGQALSIDRPDVSNLPVTVNPHQYQVEIGGEFGESKYFREEDLPNLLFRTGLSNKSELRLGITASYYDTLENSRKDRVLFAIVSGKYRIVEEKKGRPAIAVQPEFSLPFGSGTDSHSNEANFPEMYGALILLFSNTLSNDVVINYNTGVYLNGKDEVDYLLSFSAGFASSKRLGYFLEAYSFFDVNNFPVSFDGGLTYLLHPRLQLDFYVGNRYALDSRFWFSGAGVGFRIDRSAPKKDTVPKT